MVHLLLGGVLVCFCACASGTKAKGDEPATPYIWLTDNSRYILLPTGDIEYPLDSHQLISASYQGKDYVLNAWVKADTAELNMTIINELGANMGELSYRNGAASFSSPVLSLPFKPEYIIADFQFCFYQARALFQSLKYGGLSFEEIKTNRFEDTWTVRHILLGDHKTVIIRIEKKSRNVIELVNHLRGYAYTLEGNF
jgi:hypothetical protein